MANHSRLQFPLIFLSEICKKKRALFLVLALLFASTWDIKGVGIAYAQAENDPPSAPSPAAGVTLGGAVGGAAHSPPALDSAAVQAALDTAFEAMVVRLPSSDARAPVKTASRPGRDVVNPCEGITAASALSGLSYMGHSFNPTNARCFRASTDLQAKINTSGVRFINPANPEYGSRISGGNVDFNPAGYYISIDSGSNERKRDMCLRPNVGNALSDVPNGEAMLRNTLSPEFRTYRRTDGTEDGDCYCRQNRSRANPQGELAICTAAAYQVALQSAVDSARAVIDAREARSAAALAAAAPPPVNPAAGPASPTTVVAAPPANPSQSRIVSCIEQASTMANSCRTLANEAKADCDRAQRENQTNEVMGDMLGAGAQMNTMMRAGTGAQGNCMRASLITMAASTALEKMGESCEPKVNSCKDSCKSDSYERVLEDCLANNGTSSNALSDSSNTSREAEVFRQRNEQIVAGFDRADRICNRELSGLLSDANKLMNGLGNSMQASLQCACQTSSAAGANCQAVPNINNCNTNPSLAGCEVYGALGACVPGAVGYDAKSCNCLQNPAAAGCNSAGSTTPATLFGGNLRGSPAAGGSFAGGGAAAGGSGGRAGNLDLSSAPDAVQSSLSGDATVAAAKPGGAYGGSVGAGGSGNGNAPEEAALPGAAPEGGLGGLFNQAKNAVMNALGKGGSRNTRAAGRNAAAEPNMKKFKPLRGLANSEGMGTRNMDIWKMVNMCANGETCASNRNNYMMTP